MSKNEGKADLLAEQAAYPTDSVEAVLQDAVNYLANAFDSDEEVDGANLVEWFGEWRQRAKLALSQTLSSSNDTAGHAS